MLAPDTTQDADLPVLALRAASGPGRGAGHLARCLALGQAWVGSGGRCILVTDDLPEPWTGRYAAAGIVRVDADRPVRADWWVVDGYDLDLAGRPAGAHLARIDDHGLSASVGAEVLLDQNLGATADSYPGTSADLLLGTRYALLRQDLVEAAAAAGGSPAARGGAPTHVVVVLGGAPAPAALAWADAVTAELAGLDLTVEVLRGDADPAPSLARVEVALAASGSVVWELCLFRVPSVLVSVAPNQEPLGEALQARGAGRYLGRLDAVPPSAAADAVRVLALDQPARRAQVEAMTGLVDGRGASRVATRLRAGLLVLRRVGAADVDLVYELNNHPSTRAVSFDRSSITRPEHEAWFAARLRDPAAHLHLAHDAAGRLVGLVRFTVHGDEAEIGVVVAPDRRGRGWGSALIDAGVRRLFADTDVRTVIARITPDNHASRAAFSAADFDPRAPEPDGVLRYARSHVRPARA